MGKTRKRGDKECCGELERKLYLQEPLLECRVQDSELNFLTDLPGGLDYNEWLASHTIAFFEHINLIYGTVSEFCTTSSCPDMVGPGPRQYLWVDEKGKKSRYSAPQYVDLLMTYVQKTINDETVFPTKHGNEFPSSFDAHIRKIHRFLWHVIAHVYHAHFREVVLLQLHAHLNSVFAHFVEFHLRFHTLEEKELEVLGDLIVALRLVQPDNQNSGIENNNPEDSPDSSGGSNGNVYDDQANSVQAIVDVQPMDEVDPEASNGSSVAMDEGASDEQAQSACNDEDMPTTSDTNNTMCVENTSSSADC